MRTLARSAVVCLFLFLPIMAGDAGLMLTGGRAFSPSLTPGFDIGISSYAMFNKVIGLGGDCCFSALSSGKSDFFEVSLTPVVKIPLARKTDISLLLQPGYGFFVHHNSSKNWNLYFILLGDMASQASMRTAISINGAVLQFAWTHNIGSRAAGVPASNLINVNLGYDWKIKASPKS